MSLSIVLATFNESQNIERCLTSVYDIADEIVLVDGNSTDDTVARAEKLDKKHKIKFIQTDNHPNFHINKKKGIEAAKGDWIFQIDADEALSKELQTEISNAVAQSISKDGYWVTRLNFFLGRPLRKGGQYPDKTLRLYQRGKGVLPAQDVHEQARVDGTTGDLFGDLLHYPYPDFKTYIDKWVRYTVFETERMRKIGKYPTFIDYCIIKPKLWFLSTYFRHKGFQDGVPGFIFSLFSALRFPAQYAIMWEKTRKSSLNE